MLLNIFLVFHILQVSLDVFQLPCKNGPAMRSDTAAICKSLKKFWRSGVQYKNDEIFFDFFWKNSFRFETFW